MHSIDIRDLIHIFHHTEKYWRKIDGENIFVTGGTGFFGKWIVESYLYAVKKLNLKSKMTILTRNIENAININPDLFEKPEIELIEDDVRYFTKNSCNKNCSYKYFVHAATDASAILNNKKPITMLDTILRGTRQSLEFAIESNTQNFLFVSSGAVYGKVNSETKKIPEDYKINNTPFENDSAYSVGKQTAEYLCRIYGEQYDSLNTKIARCFAFIGPHLPLDKHFAIGNFILNGLNKEQIEIKGDGTPIRSYLYAADLTIWLWTILFCGKKNYPYNVGSEEAKSIVDIAKIVSKNFEPALKINISKASDASKTTESYVPSTLRAKEELNLKQWNDLESSIQKTIDWHFNIRNKRISQATSSGTTNTSMM